VLLRLNGRDVSADRGRRRVVGDVGRDGAEEVIPLVADRRKCITDLRGRIACDKIIF